jgi:Secretory lipase
MVANPIRWSAAVLLCAVLAACVSPADTETPTTQSELNYSRAMPTIAGENWSARGTVISNSPDTQFAMDRLPAGSTAHTMVYRSISGITGAPTIVSGAVFTPPGTPPPGGWPVIGYAHGTVGLTADCAPTADPELFGDISAVAIQLQLGYAVVFTDFAGMSRNNPAGSADASPHAYLEPKSAAFNLIDAVRAGRTVDPTLSSRWVALGASQGGAAVWAAAEYFAAYGQGTDLLGSAALVPALDFSAIVEHAQDSTLTTQQRYLYPYIVRGLAAVDPSIHDDDYLHGALKDNEDTLLACRPPASTHKGELADQVALADTKPSTAAAADRLTQRLAAYALPQQPTTVPLLAIYGGADDTVLPEWTEVAMGRACALKDNVLRVRMEGQGHTLDPGALLGDWVGARFAGSPAVGNC